MKFNDFLTEAELPNPDPSAKTSKQLLPQQPEDELEDDMPPEEEDSEDEQGDGDSAIEDFKDIAGAMGGDLYSTTIFNYDNSWANPETLNDYPNIIRSVARNSVGAAAVDKLLDIDSGDIARTRAVAQVIVNAQNGETFAFLTGIDGGPKISPSIKDALASNLITREQANILTQVMDAGKRYRRAVDALDNEGWKPGEEPNAKTYDAEMELLDLLASPEIQKTLPNVKSVSKLSPLPEPRSEKERLFRELGNKRREEEKAKLIKKRMRGV